MSLLPGETVALVGATGAGKSTALMLLHRAFDPQSGSIRIDGVDIRDIQISALRRNIGVVFQEALLFNRSIAENLRVGKPDATDEQMRGAAARAQALDFIEYNVEGFDAIVGERGRSLSGGERQRLSIARALLKDPPILILDEATSALDAATETRVLAALDEVMKNRTTFVIAHRLATIRNATRILVFDHGRIVEMGTFDELKRLRWPFCPAHRGAVRADRGIGANSSSTRNRGEHREIPVAKVRRDPNCKEGRDIDRGCSAQTDGKGALRRLASPPGEATYGNTCDKPRAGTEQGRRFQDIVNALQRRKGRPIQKRPPCPAVRRRLPTL